MGALALRRLGDRLFSPTAGVVGAGLLALVVLFPTPSEARFEVGKECSAQPQTRGAIRVLASCKGQILAKSVLPERRLIGGKLGAMLAAELYCRTSSVDLSEFERMAPACLPHASPSQRLIDANGAEAVEWPATKLSPAPAAGMIGALTVARLPDG